MLDSGKSVYSALCPTMTRVVVRVRGYAPSACVAECGLLYTSLRGHPALVVRVLAPWLHPIDGRSWDPVVAEASPDHRLTGRGGAV